MKRLLSLRNLLAFVLALLFCYGISTTNANEVPTPETIFSPEFNQFIVKMEEDWADQYEEYFEGEFENLGMQVQTMSQELQRISDETGHRTAVVWLMSQPEKLNISVLTPGNPPILRNIYDAKDEKIKTQLFSLRNNIVAVTKRHRQDYFKNAQQLYQWIIKPIEATLEINHIDTLLFCAGSGLRTLPYSVLHDGKQFLSQKYRLGTIPAFNLTSIQYRPLTQARVLAMGASEFAEYSPLPGVNTEIQNIVPTLWQGSSFLNEAFTLKKLQQQRQDYPFEIIHLATHAVFESGDADQSYIQLFNEKLRLSELGRLDWRQPPVELLVLSACETALGDQQAELGFAGLAVQAGVRSAIASLWRVSDLGSLALMSEFYHNLKTTSTKAEALQKAQISMMEGKVYVKDSILHTTSQDIELPDQLISQFPQNFAHPYYWSAYSLIGSPW